MDSQTQNNIIDILSTLIDMTWVWMYESSPFYTGLQDIYFKGLYKEILKMLQFL